MFEDYEALKTFEELSKKWKYGVIIETGTFFGESTMIFTRFCKEVHTIEVNPSCFGWASEYLNYKGMFFKEEDKFEGFTRKRFEDVNGNKVFLYLGSSELVLDKLAPLFKDRKPLYFLDAHWADYWPLKDELINISKTTHDCYVIIHDFKVPGKDYGYDSYKGIDCDYAFVEKELKLINPNFKIFYNTKACEGAKARGILYCSNE